MNFVPFCGYSSSLPRQRIRPNLEVHDLAFSALSAFDMPHEVGTVIRPEPAAFPAGVRIVDAPVHTARIESEGIRNAQLDPLICLRIERQHRVGIGSGGERSIFSESRYVVLIHPIVIVKVRRNLSTLQLRTIGLI